MHAQTSVSSAPDLLGLLDPRRAPQNPDIQSCQDIPREADAALHAALHVTCRSLHALS